MTLKEITYMILEEVRNNNISDDENIDLRLIEDWVNIKRAQFIKNQMSINPNGRLNLNLYQPLNVTVQVSTLTDNGFYPYTTAVEDSKIVQSTSTIPNIIEGKNGPMILTIESEDLMKLPFSVVDYGYMRIAGNGKFNSNLIFASVRDNKLYFKYNVFFDTYTTVVLRAVFEDPRDVPGFSVSTSTYPVNLGLIEYIKNSIFDKDMRMILNTKQDIDNDASGVVK